MGIKVWQGLEASWHLSRNPLNTYWTGRFIEASGDFWLLRLLQERMLEGVPAEQVEHLRRLTERGIDEAALLALPENTFGHCYAVYQRRHGYNIDGRHVDYPPVNELFDRNWLLYRFSRTHDMLHLLLGFGIDEPAEAAMQLFHLVNFREPYGVLAMASLPLILYRHGRSEETFRMMRRSWSLARQMQNVFVAPLEEMFPLELEEVRRRLAIPIAEG